MHSSQIEDTSQPGSDTIGKPENFSSRITGIEGEGGDRQSEWAL